MPEDPNFAIYIQERTMIPLLEGRVDGYPVEEHRLDLGTTENPVESGAELTDNAVKRREKLQLQGWVSDILPAPGYTASPDRAADTWAEIIELFKARTPIVVVTALRVYRNMLVIRAVAPVDKLTGRALRFTLDLAEVLYADTAVSQFNARTVDQEGEVADKTATVDRGFQTPGPPEEVPS